MFKKVFLALIIPLLVLLVGCYQAPKPILPGPVLYYPIPPNFTTYTQEGVFEISYPNDWRATPQEIEEWNTQDAQSFLGQTGEVGIQPKGQRLWLSAGRPTSGDYAWENLLSVLSYSKPTFWTVKDIVDGRRLWSEKVLQSHREMSRLNTIISGQDGIIVEESYHLPTYGQVWYLTLYIIYGDTVWEVNCLTDAETQSLYEGTFRSVLKSFRILR